MYLYLITGPKNILRKNKQYRKRKRQICGIINTPWLDIDRIFTQNQWGCRRFENMSKINSNCKVSVFFNCGAFIKLEHRQGNKANLNKL